MAKNAHKILSKLSKGIKIAIQSDEVKSILHSAKNALIDAGLVVLEKVLVTAVKNNEYFTLEDQNTKVLELDAAFKNLDHKNKKSSEEFATEIIDILFGGIGEEDDANAEDVISKIKEIKFDITQIMNGNGLYMIELASDISDLKDDLAEYKEAAEAYVNNDSTDDQKPEAALTPTVAQQDEVVADANDEKDADNVNIVAEEKTTTESANNTEEQAQNDEQVAESTVLEYENLDTTEEQAKESPTVVQQDEVVADVSDENATVAGNTDTVEETIATPTLTPNVSEEMLNDIAISNNPLSETTDDLSSSVAILDIGVLGESTTASE